METQTPQQLDGQLKMMVKLSKQKNTKRIHDLEVTEARESAQKMAQLLKLPPLEGVKSKEVLFNKTADTLKTRYFSTDFSIEKPIYIYFHGGGYVLYNIESHDTICEHLALHLDCHVIAVEYRKAPEFPAPVPFQDSLAAYKLICNSGNTHCIANGKIIIGGDSVGGNLCLQLYLYGKLEIEPQLIHLIYPVLDFSFSFPSYKEFGEDYFLDTDTMKWFLNLFIGENREKNIQDMSFLNDDIDRINIPVYLGAAGCDVLRDEARQFLEISKKYNKKVIYEEFDSLPHNFLLFAGKIKACKKAFNQMLKSMKILFNEIN